MFKLLLNLLALATVFGVTVTKQISCENGGDSGSYSVDTRIGNPTITVNAGDLLTLMFNDNCESHPLVLKQAGMPYINGFEIGDNATTLQTTVTTPAVLEYQCSLHPKMKGTISVVGGASDASTLVVSSGLVAVLAVFATL